ncbi:hypothetical protein D9758_012940 [Tetrapyrgos nigripes]|uniref:F-box domain-containing protein n=1 Tax=Tetrapyrgos nigripes TaxID=182062 RepID=A0A8H5FNZ8_9AGAR|nr:hypothetical protein D9758_012940 [Tetrapyrgos nigripes]
MHPVLQVVELLHIIFEHLKPKDQFSCATVCRLWSEVTLDILWYELDDLKLPVFASLLSPLKEEENVSHQENAENSEDTKLSYAFADDPPNANSKDWRRFELNYCSRIRVLRFEGNLEGMHKHMFSPVLMALQRIRPPSSPLLPNLHALTWDGTFYDFAHSVMFMHEGVRHCCMRYGIDDVPKLDLNEFPLVQAIQTRMLSLTSLELEMVPYEELLGPLAELFGYLVDLTSLLIPIFPDITPILSSLSNAKKLNSLQITGHEDDVDNSVVQAGGQLEGDALKSLGVLEIIVQSYLKTLSPFLSCNHLASLHTLEVESCSVETAVTIKNLFQLVPSFAPNLVGCMFGFLENGEECREHFESHRIYSNSLTLDSFRGILQCRGIEAFQLDHPNLHLTNSDIEEIASAWPRLKSFEVYSTLPFHVRDIPTPTLRALFTLTRLCPNLEEVGLLMDTDLFNDSKDRPAYANMVISAARPNLMNLEVGCSEIGPGDAASVARTLSHVCRPDCQLSWADTGRTMMARWKTVEENLPLFSRLHATVKDQKTRISFLEQELETLQERISGYQGACGGL